MKYFKNKEDFKGNMDKMDPKLLSMLDELREEYGYPIILNSSYRSPDHPIEAVKSKPGEHTYGAAVDIKCAGGENTFNLVAAAIKVGFRRIGISRKSNFVHVGIGYPNAPETTIWTY
jgi:uncharacterized protein YcbK (DUF882 family)|tara:strand:- start:699 stop:1049 length:351 start_codon:yes stop_codon:yes gene_type:complete